MNDFINMTYNDIISIEDKNKKREYLEKYRFVWINFINPLYDGLSKQKREEYDNFDIKFSVSMYDRINKFKELYGGSENVKKVLSKRWNK